MFFFRFTCYIDCTQNTTQISKQQAYSSNDKKCYFKILLKHFLYKNKKIKQKVNYKII